MIVLSNYQNLQRKTINLPKNVLFWKTQNSLESVFSAHIDTKASVVERFNRTNATLKYLDFLLNLVKGYNASAHRAIGITPKDVNLPTTIHIPTTIQKVTRLNYPKRYFYREIIGKWDWQLFRFQTWSVTKIFSIFNQNIL